ncbi:MAG: SDR family oxidoreductase [Candidatus Neomarinimicrobiota bacterium]|nr:SDR family oxidoreductase [Candidatus Neomarinimicrobiota bacterium]
MNIELTGRKAIVCGSTQGLGRAAAEELVSLGATVTLVARNEESLTTVRDSLKGDGHLAVCADFSDQDMLRERINAHVQRHGPFHILVNNTGGPPPGEIAKAESGEFIDAFSKHLICNQILTKTVLPGMKSEGYGRIINIISTSVKQPIPNLGVSNTIRGAVANWAKTLSREVAPYGITVNNVLPGTTNTARLHELFSAMASKRDTDPKTIEEERKNKIPVGRIAQPEEIAAAIAFLASPAASFISGINLPVDGGRLMCL